MRLGSHPLRRGGCPMRCCPTPLVAFLFASGLAHAADERLPLGVDETPLGTAAAAVVETITSSPDGRRLAYAGREGDKLVLVVDGKTVSGAYDGFALNGI